MPVPRALPYPWSPWDPEDGGTPLDNQDWTLDARSSMLILTDVDTSLQTTSRHAMVHCGRRISLPNGTAATTWHVGAPTRESDITTIKIEDTHGKREATLAFTHAVGRPVPSRPALDAALDLENLIGVQIDRIDAAIKLGLKRRSTTGAIAGLVRPEWPELESTIPEGGRPQRTDHVRHRSSRRDAG